MPLPQLSLKSKKQRAIEAYNRALEAKYASDWPLSLSENQRADQLRPGDEATLWNLAIAATALHEWDVARSAWKRLNIPVNDGPGEVRFRGPSACVRLNPNRLGEVVWGTRIDPARIVINNVPLPESDRRFRDIVLNDGAQEGTRISKGEEYPVFNELGLWQSSSHSTFGVTLSVPNESAAESLYDRCHAQNIGMDDWRTMRILCAACSRGNPGEHDCADRPNGQTRWGFGATSEAVLRQLLTEWAETEPGAAVGEIELLLSAKFN